MKNNALALGIITLLLLVSSCSDDSDNKTASGKKSEQTIEYRIYADEAFDKNAQKVRADLETQIKQNNISDDRADSLRKKVEKGLAEKYEERIEKKSSNTESTLEEKFDSIEANLEQTSKEFEKSIENTSKSLEENIDKISGEIDKSLDLISSDIDSGNIPELQISEGGIQIDSSKIGLDVNDEGINIKTGENGEGISVGSGGIGINLGDFGLTVGEDGIKMGAK